MRAGLLKGKTIGIDAATFEASAAMKSIVRRGTEYRYTEYLKRLAEAPGSRRETNDTAACDAAGSLVVDADPDSPPFIGTQRSPTMVDEWRDSAPLEIISALPVIGATAFGSRRDLIWLH